MGLRIFYAGVPRGGCREPRLLAGGMIDCDAGAAVLAKGMVDRLGYQGASRIGYRDHTALVVTVQEFKAALAVEQFAGKGGPLGRAVV